MTEDKNSGWQKVYEAVRAIGRPCSIAEIKELLPSMYPAYKTLNVRDDICKITINALARGHHKLNAEARRPDTGHKWDLIYQKSGGTGSLKYELYQPKSHPVWELYRDETLKTKGKVRTRPVAVGPWVADMYQAQREAEDAGSFDPSNEADGRRRVMTSIVSRRGQQRFRAALLEAYDGVCAMTGSTDAEVLEAAHIVPYKGEHTNAVQNGLLLRADVHTLFDLGHLWVVGGKIGVADHLLDDCYRSLAGKPLREPVDAKSAPSREALELHAKKATGKSDN